MTGNRREPAIRNFERVRQRDAAAQLERLSAALDRAAQLLRAGQPRGRAYALVYLLRRELGYVVSALGAATPLTSDASWARHALDAASCELADRSSTESTEENR